MIYTVILDYNDDTGSTYLCYVEAKDPKEAGELAKLDLAFHAESREDTPDETLADTAAGYTVIAVIEGEHQDVYPHN